jgi:NitT/TauT family transport system permease protein
MTENGLVQTGAQNRAPRKQRRPAILVAARIGGYVLVLGAWILLAMLLGRARLPGPDRVWNELVRIVENGIFWPNFLVTMRVFLLSFGIGFGVGAILGVLMGRTNYFESFFRDGITILMGLPGVVIIVVSLMMFGLSPWGRVTAVALGLIPLVAINIAEGARGIPKDLLDMATSYEATRYEKLRHVIWPASAPYVFTGARYGLAIGFKATAMVEVFGGNSGMGFQLRTRFSDFSVAGVLAWTLLILAIVIILELGILKPTERRIFRWRQSAFN